MSEPPLNCRKRSDDIETRVQLLPWDEPGGCLLTGLAVSGTKVARARFRLQCGTWERLAPMGSASCWSGRREGELQAAETVRGGVPMRGRRADHPVVAVMPGNAAERRGWVALVRWSINRPGREESDDRTEVAGQAV